MKYDWCYTEKLNAEGAYVTMSNAITKDKGTTWNKILDDYFLRGVDVDPKNPMDLYAASSSARDAGGYNPNSHGLLLTRDCGKNWKQANEGLSWPFAWCVEVDPRDPSFVFGGFCGQNFKKDNLMICRLSQKIH